MFFSKTITIASLMALLVSSALATGETYLVAAFAGMQVFGSDGCAGQLVSTVTGFSEDVWGECWNNPEPTTCMTLHDIAGGEHLCEVRTYYAADCQGPFGFFPTDHETTTTKNTEATYSFKVLCA